MKHYIFLAVVIGLIVLAYITKPVSVPVVVVPLSKMYGETVCSTDNHPVIVLTGGILGTLNEAHILVHERTHVRQMQQYKGGCKVLMERFQNDHHFRVMEELEAYCAQAKFVKETMPEQYDDISLYIQFVMKQVYDTTGVACKP